MNWDDPVERLHLIEQVGAATYNRMFEEHRRATTVAVVNGYHIRPVASRFGRLMMVEGTDKAFRTLSEARAFADRQPTAKGKP